MLSSENPQQFTVGKNAIQQMAGCFLVDYSYVETEELQPRYKRDNAVYDVNKNKSVKEWIFLEEISPTRFKLQHVLQAQDMSGKLLEGSVMKHTGEDWEFNAPFWYDYQGRNTWTPHSLAERPELWLRRITSLDDGLRYQCAAAWKLDTAYPEWSCDGFAPIPGRETRDMKRNDYHALDRSTRIISYGPSWLERQANTKVINNTETRTPLAKELGKNWYVRLPDEECRPAQEFVQPRLAFWRLVTEAWDTVLDGKQTIAEKGDAASFSRYTATLKLEKEYMDKNLNDSAIRAEAKQKLVDLFRSMNK
ncbi:hypothetical protein QQ054_34055 [Oscillatoria amoena NRMC-F 0135]|nr:hypothetical protein [Oscillatoria amoena NRMC-F 0135]